VRPVLNLLKIVPLTALAAASLLAGCSDPASMSPAERARFTKEIVDPRPECKPFVDQLTAAGADAAAVQRAYQAAKAGGCLRPNV
jgi:hypothetical protein